MVREMYLEGLSEDPDVPLTIDTEPAAQRQFAASGNGPVIRKGVDTGAEVVDLAAMIKELEGNPDARKRS